MSISVQNLSTFIKTSTKEEVADVFDRATTKTSFWGARRVYIEGFDGSEKLWNIIKKYQSEAAGEASLACGFDPNNPYHKIAKKITELVDASVDQENELHWITRVSLCAREFFWIKPFDICSQTVCFRTSGHNLSTFMKTATQEEVASVFDRAETELSFWGARKVHIEGFEGSVKLWNVIKKYKPENTYTPPSYKFDPHNPYHQIAKKITVLVDSSLRQDRELHWITRIFLFLREGPAIKPFDIYSQTDCFHIPTESQDEIMEKRYPGAAERHKDALNKLFKKKST